VPSAGSEGDRGQAIAPRRRDTLDKNEKLSYQLAWLRKAGFTNVDAVYRNRLFILTVAGRT